MDAASSFLTHQIRENCTEGQLLARNAYPGLSEAAYMAHLMTAADLVPLYFVPAYSGAALA